MHSNVFYNLIAYSLWYPDLLNVLIIFTSFIHLCPLDSLQSKGRTDVRQTTDGLDVFTVYKDGSESCGAQAGVESVQLYSAPRSVAIPSSAGQLPSRDPDSKLGPSAIQARHVWHVWWARADMTVLTEDTSPVIMTSGLGGDRYITPEYLAPLPQVFFLNFHNKSVFPSEPSRDNLIWVLCPKNVVTT